MGAGFDGSIRTFCTYGGSLMAMGFFENSGATATPYFSRWTGSSWTGYVGGPADAVYCGTEWNGDLFLGGRFEEVAAGPVEYITRFDGSSYHTVATPPAGGLDAYVETLTDYQGQIIAGGAFSTGSQLPLTRIGAWNGSTWSPLGSGLDSDVRDLVTYGNDLVAVGFFANAGGVAANDVARWNGTNWSSFGAGTDGYCEAAAVYGGDLYIGGSFTTVSGVARAGTERARPEGGQRSQQLAGLRAVPARRRTGDQPPDLAHTAVTPPRPRCHHPNVFWPARRRGRRVETPAEFLAGEKRRR
jgi:hypothetical protein